MLRLLFLTSLMIALGARSPGATSPALSDKPSAKEQPFVSMIAKDLQHRFATTAQAQAAGYVRYTDEDETGAISYTNRKWSSDKVRPSQLWYDVHHNLLGADFSILKADSPKPPNLWSIDARRWQYFPAHIHYILRNSDGSLKYAAMGVGKFVRAGGNILAPQAAVLEKAKIVRDAGDVQQVFLFPELWDLIVWVKPNPNGAFAEKNPNVTPSKNAKMSM
ncbi:MAG: hypothetical protein M3Z14_00215 [Candidatus Eremiobacteraeota bacterium]|nr:hypothetical protein [Candidatus Eremiobacteraeota bacterium]